jgi:heme exporter protein D
MAEFFAMNGYAFYIWGSYGVALFIFAVEIVMVRHRRKNALREVRMMRDEMGEDGTGEAA